MPAPEFEVMELLDYPVPLPKLFAEEWATLRQQLDAQTPKALRLANKLYIYKLLYGRDAWEEPWPQCSELEMSTQNSPQDVRSAKTPWRKDPPVAGSVDSVTDSGSSSAPLVSGSAPSAPAKGYAGTGRIDTTIPNIVPPPGPAKKVEVLKNLVFVDCEAKGAAPCCGQLTEFAAKVYPDGPYFHATEVDEDPEAIFLQFWWWLKDVFGDRRPIFVSDNPAFDWQWINDGFWEWCVDNPFGHSARRIGDFYAGLRGDFTKSSNWKSLRKTKHDHNSLHDVQGNIEAFSAMLAGKR